MKLNFPPATEEAKTEDPFQPDAVVEFIDGNHTQHVMLQLQELCPEIEEHKTRFSSTRSCHQELSFLNWPIKKWQNFQQLNLRTCQFEELTIMRNVLLEKYEGYCQHTRKGTISQPRLLIHQPQSVQGVLEINELPYAYCKTPLGKMMKTLAALK